METRPHSEHRRMTNWIAYMARHPRTEGSDHIANVRGRIGSWLTALQYPFFHQDVSCYEWSCLSGPSLTVIHGEDRVAVPCFPVVGSGSTMFTNEGISKPFIYGRIGNRTRITAADRSKWVGLPILLVNGKPSGCMIISRQDGTYPVAVENSDPNQAFVGVSYDNFLPFEGMKKARYVKGRGIVRAEVKTKHEPIVAPNIIVGNRDAKILVIAHLDSLPGSPGANDNASGIAALMEVLRSFPPDNYCAVITCGEEIGMYGAKALQREIHQNLTICLDSVGNGGLIVQATPNVNLPINYPYTPRSDFGAYDLGVFTENENDGILITSRGEHGYYKHAHRPTDTVGEINPGLVLQAAAVVKDIIMQNMLHY